MFMLILAVFAVITRTLTGAPKNGSLSGEFVPARSLGCAAHTTKGTLCAHSVTSGCTVESDGYIYRLCNQHFNMVNNLVLRPSHRAEKIVGTVNNISSPMADAMYGELTNKENNVDKDRYFNLNGDGLTYEEREAAGIAQAEENAYGDAGPEDDEILDATPIMVTAHRPNQFSSEDVAKIPGLLEEFWTKAKEKWGVVRAISGGADGGDRWFARSAIKAAVPYDLYLPHVAYYPTYHKGQAWTKGIEDHAVETVYSFPADKKWHFSMNFKRNLDMIQAAEVHVVISNMSIEALKNAKNGGTAHAVKAMKDAGVERVVHINPRRNTLAWVIL